MRRNALLYARIQATLQGEPCEVRDCKVSILFPFGKARGKLFKFFRCRLLRVWHILCLLCIHILYATAMPTARSECVNVPYRPSDSVRTALSIGLNGTAILAKRHDQSG